MKRNIFVCTLSILFIVLGAGFVLGASNDDQILSLSLINQDPDPASSGDIVELRIGVENRGGAPAEDVVLELDPQYPFSLVSGDDGIENVGTIGAYHYDSDVKIVKFTVRVDRDATEGQYELKVMRYTEANKDFISTTSLNIDVESKQSAEIIYIDQVELIPGRITPLKFTINNVGSSPLRDLSFQWENEDDIILPVGSDNTKYVRYIDVGGSAELEFNVIASAIADPDLYKLDLTLSYDDPVTGEETEISTKAGVYVGGATDFDVAFSGSSGGESSFSISNIGSVAASSVTVRVPDQEGWRVSGSNSVIIGNLNEGDYTIASFTLQQRDSGDFAAGQYGSQTDQAKNVSSRQAPEDSTVVLEIVYTDSRGNRNTVTKDVSIDASAFMTSTAADDGTAAASTGRMRPGSANTSAWSRYKWPTIILAVIVLLIYVHRIYRKRKKDDPGYTYSDMVKSIFSGKNAKKKR